MSFPHRRLFKNLETQKKQALEHKTDVRYYNHNHCLAILLVVHEIHNQTSHNPQVIDRYSHNP